MIVISTSYDAVSRLLAACARGFLTHTQTAGHAVSHLLEAPYSV
jgi:hypothetical protein